MPLSRILVLCWSLTVAVGVQAAAVERVLVVSIDALHPAALTADAGRALPSRTPSPAGHRHEAHDLSGLLPELVALRLQRDGLTQVRC